MICRSVGLKAQKQEPGRFRAMSMTGRWLVKQSIDAQRARDAVMPAHSDSPAVMYALIVFATALLKWTTWEGTPTVQHAPNLCLFANVLDRLATMTMGAFCMPDMGYLDRPEEVTPHGLVLEGQSIEAELEGLIGPLARWRADAPAHLGAGFDRLSLATIQSIEEFRYFESAGILNTLSDRLQAIEATINMEMNRSVPLLPNPRVCITPSSGSHWRDGEPMHQPTLGPGLIACHWRQSRASRSSAISNQQVSSTPSVTGYRPLRRPSTWR